MAAVQQHSLTSSPDLLGAPADDPRSSPVRDANRARSTTPRKQISQPLGSYQLQDFYIDTPNGTVTRRTSPSKASAQAENLISPWRIRVRVEAEREEESARSGGKSRRKTSMSPSKRVARTVTTTVPLKGSDDTPAPQKRGRGRPRKAATPAKTPAKRPATPKPRRGRKRNADDIGNNPPGEIEQNDMPVSKRPKSRGSQESARSEPSTEANQASEWDRLKIPSPLVGARGSSKGVFDIAMDSDTSTNSRPQANESRQNAATNSQENAMNFPSQSSEKGRQPLAPTSLQRGRPRSTLKEVADLITSEMSEGISDYDSIAEGEDFSVVSLSTLPSAQQHLNSRAQRSVNGSALQNSETLTSGERTGPKELSASQAEDAHHSVQNTNSSKPTEVLKLHGSSATGKERKSADQSSLLNIDLKQATSSQTFSSPVLPPVKTVRNRSLSKAVGNPKNSARELARVMKDGVALRGAVDPRESTEKQADRTIEDTEPSRSHTRDRFDNLFSGFGVQTRRELRAGLRLGEELAKRQQPKEEPIQDGHSSEDDIFQAIANSGHSQTLEGDTNIASQKTATDDIRYPRLPNRRQLPSPETSLDEDAGHTKKGGGVKGDMEALPSPTHSVLEREAVSRQIAGADSDKVMIINTDENSSQSTDNDHDEDQTISDRASQGNETDIWQNEAKSTSNSHNNSYISSNTNDRQAERTAQPQPDEREPDHLFDPLLPASRQTVSDLYPDLSTAVQYSTPPPQKQPHKQDTNFTDNMLEAEGKCQPKKMFARSPIAKISEVIHEPKKFPAPQAKRQSSSNDLAPTLFAAATNLKRWQDNHIDVAGAAARDSRSLAQQRLRLEAQRKTQDQHAATQHVSWMEACSDAILHTAAEAMTTIASYEPSILPRKTTFSAPVTPASRPIPPFTIYLPFNNTHYNRLRAIYLSAQRHPKLYSLDPESPYAEFLGLDIESMGWSRKLETWELAVVDEFMSILRGEGIRDEGQQSEASEGFEEKKEIGIEEVVKRVFSVWVGQVQRGEVLLKEGTAGSWDKRFVGQRKRALERQKAWRETRKV